MAFSTSGLFGPNISLTLARAANSMILGATGASFGGVASGTTQDSWKIALFNNNITPNFNDTVAHNAYGTTAAQSWPGTTTTNESSGTGWAAGGVALTSPVLSNNSTTPFVAWTAANVSQASTTLSNIYGCLIYDITATIVANIGLLCLAFAGAPYGTSNGTFGITWSGSGIWTWGW